MDIKLVPAGLLGSNEAGDFESEPKFSLDYSEDSSTTVQGTSLLAQMVIKLLLTKRGSTLSSPSEGTLLSNIAGTGNNVATEISATIIEDAVSSVEATIKSAQGPGSTFKASETLDAIELKSLTTTDSGLEAAILIKNSLGEAALLSVGV